MRDPARMDRMLELVRRLWLTDPDSRLLQLLINHSPGPVGRDAFYIEDDALEAQLQDVLNRRPQP